MNIKKILEFNLDMSKPLNRLIRRAVMIGILTGASALLIGLGEMYPFYLSLTTGLLALTDKGLREYQNEQEEFKRIERNSDIDVSRR